MTQSDHRRRATKKLTDIMRVIGHPDRLRILEELSHSEKDVKTLLGNLGLPPSRVSQHLRLLRAYRIVDQRSAGRRRVYHLVQPKFVSWITRGFEVVENRLVGALDIEAGDAL